MGEKLGHYFRRRAAALGTASVVGLTAVAGGAALAGCGSNGLGKDFSSYELHYTKAAGLGGVHKIINPTDNNSGGLNWSRAGNVSFTWYDPKIGRIITTQMDLNNVQYRQESASTPPNSDASVVFEFNTDEITGGGPCNPNVTPCRYVIYNNDQPNAYLGLQGATAVVLLTNSEFNNFMRRAPTPPPHK